MKFVILVIIVLAVLVWFQRLKKNLVEKARQATQAAEQYRRNAEATANSSGAAAGPASVGGASPQVETMVACVHCGLHFPASEAVTDHAGAIFCSEEHRRLQVAEATRAP